METQMVLLQCSERLSFVMLTPASTLRRKTMKDGATASKEKLVFLFKIRDWLDQQAA